MKLDATQFKIIKRHSTHEMTARGVSKGKPGRIHHEPSPPVRLDNALKKLLRTAAMFGKHIGELLVNSTSIQATRINT
jgi:hypothetical protein